MTKTNGTKTACPFCGSKGNHKKECPLMNKSKLEIKPWNRLLDLFPSLSSEEYEALENSLKQDGQQNPIVVSSDGLIIDGYHRWKILGDIVNYTISPLTEEEAYNLGIILNIARRQLSQEQKREIVTKLRKAGKTQQETADILHLARSTISNWEKGTTGKSINDIVSTSPDLRVTINKREHPAIHKRIVEGETPKQVASDYKVTPKRIKQIKNQVEQKIEKAKPSKKVLPSFISQIMQHLRNLLLEAGATKVVAHDTFMLVLGDANQLIKAIPDQRVSLILSDPPYNLNENSIQFNERSNMNTAGTEAWNKNYVPTLIIPECKRVLHELGNIIFFTSDILFGEYYPVLSKMFDKVFSGAWHKTNPAPQVRKTTFVSSIETWISAWDTSHIFNFGKQNDMHNFIEGPICSNRRVAEDGTTHIAQKPAYVWEKIIKACSTEMDFVLDLYAGTGSCGIVAVKLGRMYIGFEKDPKWFKVMVNWFTDEYGIAPAIEGEDA